MGPAGGAAHAWGGRQAVPVDVVQGGARDWYPGYAANAAGRPLAMLPRKRKAVRRVNADFNVRGLCMQLPYRLRMLESITQGDWLPR